MVRVPGPRGLQQPWKEVLIISSYVSSPSNYQNKSHAQEAWTTGVVAAASRVKNPFLASIASTTSQDNYHLIRTKEDNNVVVVIIVMAARRAITVQLLRNPP